MKHIVSRMSSYFPNRWPLSYLNLTKNMKTHIRCQQHKKFKHQDIKQKEPPQKYRLGTISNTKLLAGLNRFYRYLTSPSPKCLNCCNAVFGSSDGLTQSLSIKVLNCLTLGVTVHQSVLTAVRQFSVPETDGLAVCQSVAETSLSIKVS